MIVSSLNEVALDCTLCDFRVFRDYVQIDAG